MHFILGYGWVVPPGNSEVLWKKKIKSVKKPDVEFESDEASNNKRYGVLRKIGVKYRVSCTPDRVLEVKWKRMRENYQRC
jgi:hypothetical protein